MKIDLHNYEQYVPGFLAGTLDAATELSFVLFLEAHPQIGDLLLPAEETQLPSDGLLFPGKNNLKKEQPVNNQNIEEWLIKELEGDLQPAEQKELKEFLQVHPTYEQDRKLFSYTRLEATAINYPYKNGLKKTAFVIPYRPLAYLAAASLVLFIGIRFLTGPSTLVVPSPPVAKNTAPVVLPEKNTPPVIVTGPEQEQTAIQTTHKKQPLATPEVHQVASHTTVPVRALDHKPPGILPVDAVTIPELSALQEKTEALATPVANNGNVVTAQEYAINYLEKAKGTPSIDLPVKKRTVVNSLVAFAVNKLNNATRSNIEIKQQEKQNTEVLYVRVGELAFTNTRTK